MLLDSGAQVSVVGQTWIENTLPDSQIQPMSSLLGEYCHATAANGTPIPFEGWTVVLMELKSEEHGDLAIHVPLLVSQNCVEIPLLGFNVIEELIWENSEQPANIVKLAALLSGALKLKKEVVNNLVSAVTTKNSEERSEDCVVRMGKIGLVINQVQKEQQSDMEEEDNQQPEQSQDSGHDEDDEEEPVTLRRSVRTSNEFPSSVHMEKEGLVRCVQFLKSENLIMKTIVTDGHTQINKWLKENQEHVDHRFDVWRLAKNLKKQLVKLAKDKQCTAIGEWIQSILNHLYWCAVSTPDGNGEIIAEKWLSLNNHIINIHTKHGRVFEKCAHGRLPAAQNRKKKWLKAVKKNDMQ
ncbi:hypothetical protein KUCAC02_012576 [Chaenocephalus aceratus]|uniref:Uncharacterized protein n=1 Tax=Chaenocephalus aceratus TaxID=36190 RepID=A0ACB9XAZ5_CHAAC|nr:hypothetical protein KUCAC02_012576 [Chaenocephalus aceratus]